MTSRTAVASLALLAAACATRFDPRLSRAPIAGRPWVSTEDRHHPLVGKIYDVHGDRFVDEAALTAAAGSADYLFLGETHDNPDHHLLQARLVTAVAAAGRKPALAFEMLPADLQPAIDAAVARAPMDPDALASAWKTGGWPDFRYYRPILAAGLDAHLPIVAANVPRKTMRQVREKGQDALDPAIRERLAREPPVSPEARESLRAEMEESHCGELPETMLDPLILAQRARDATMEARLLSAGADRGAILITGKGHSRTDRGVPTLLAQDAAGEKIVSIAFFEVDAEVKEPKGYAAEWGKGRLPFDYVVFTPGASREDPCIGMEKHMKKVEAEKKRKAAEAAKAGAEGGAAPSPSQVTSTSAPAPAPAR